MSQRFTCSSGFTLVELVVAVSVTAILAAATPPLLLQGVKSFLVLSRTQLANQIAMETMHAMIEGSYSTLAGSQGQMIRGLRYASRQTCDSCIPANDPAIWMASNTQVGFLVPGDLTTSADNQYITLRLANNAIVRKVFVGAPPTCAQAQAAVDNTWETVPSYVGNTPVALTAAFQYYALVGSALTTIGAPGCPSAATIRLAAITLTAYTGTGSFDQSDANVSATSSVSIRFP